MFFSHVSSIAFDFKALPDIASFNPPNFSILSEDYVDIFVSADENVTSLKIDGKLAQFENGVFFFSGLPLFYGRNVFFVEALNSDGKKKIYVYTLYREEKSDGIQFIAKEEDEDEYEYKGSLSDQKQKAEGFTYPQKADAKQGQAVSSAENVNVNNTKSSARASLSGTRVIKNQPASVITKIITKILRPEISSSSNISVADVPSTTNSASPGIGQQNPAKPILTFSSPYNNQIITENAFKIGGRFDRFAHAESITINGQPCKIDRENFTFEGPLLLSPGEARRRGVTNDSAEYIILNVDPITHSGKNTLKARITTTAGNGYEEGITVYYYQLFIKETFESDSPVWFGSSVTGTEKHIWNANLFKEPPFPNWEDISCNIRVKGLFLDNPEEWLYFNKYKDAHYRDPVPIRYWEGVRAFWDSYYDDAPSYTRIARTHLILHTPPAVREEIKPLVLIFKVCLFVENVGPAGPYYQYLPLDLSKYLINGQPLKPLYGDFQTPAFYNDNAAYIILNNYEPDIDMPLITKIPSYKPGVMEYSYSSLLQEFFAFRDATTLNADILVDSNNDGFLGGNDNPVEQVSPGCVFWVNDDDDYDESKVHPDDKGAINSNGNDSKDEVINGIRDLEDFMPIDLTVPNIKEWTSDKNVKFILKAEGQGKIRIFRRVDETDNTYLTELEYAKKQYKEEMKFILPSSKKEGQLLDPSWFNSKGKFYGIFEGVESGELRVKLEVDLNGKDRVVLDEAVITLVDVKSLFKVYNTRYTFRKGNKEGPTAEGDGLLRYKVIREEEDYGAMFPKNPDRILIWTHGYNNTAEDSIKSMTTIFKRLYVTGFRGGFVGIAWRTHKYRDNLVGDIISTLDFNADWLASYQTGHIVAEIMKETRQRFPNTRLDVAAHSLGNNLFSYALKVLSAEKEPIVDNYILHQAAVPGEVFCGRYGTIRYIWEYTSINGIPVPLYQYRTGFFENIYAGSLRSVRGKVYNTFSTKDIIVDKIFPLNNNLFKLPTPLDDSYRFINNPISTEPDSHYQGLGRAEAVTTYYDKIESKGQFKSKTVHPYGIRGHGSATGEYYYDVIEFFKDVIVPEDMNDEN